MGTTPVAVPGAGRLLPVGAGSAPAGIVVAEGYLYWTAGTGDGVSTSGSGDDEGRRVIYRARTDGSGRTVISAGSCTRPEALAVAGGYLYWLDAAANAIGRTPLGELAGEEDDHKPCGVLRVPAAAHGLWADAQHVYWTAPGSGIGRADADGGHPTAAFIHADVTGDSELTGIGSTLVWTTSVAAGPIAKASTSGGDITRLSIGAGGEATDVATDGQSIYWTMGDGKGIGVMGFDGSDPRPGIYPSITGFGRQGPQSVAVDPGPEQTLTVQLTGDGAASGIVASVGDNAIACPRVCTADFPTGSTVHLVAATALGSGAMLSGLELSPGAAGTCSVETGGCDVVVDADTTLTATFDGVPAGRAVPMDIRFSGDGSGLVTGGTSFATTPFQCASGTPPCVNLVPLNARVTLLASEVPGSRFVGWRGMPAGSTCGGTDPTCTFTLDASTTVTAVFEPVDPPVDDASVSVRLMGNGSVSSVPVGITCPDTCAVRLPVGTTVMLLAVPATGYRVSSWSGAGCGDAGTVCEFVVGGDASIDVFFVPIGPGPQPGPDPTPAPSPTPTPAPAPAETTAPLELIKDGTPLGWVYSDPAAIACNMNCVAHFPIGTDVVLTAREAPNADFLGWGENCRGAMLTCRVAMHGARRAVARFNMTGQLTLTRLKVSTRAVVVGSRNSAARSAHARRGGALITYRVSENARVTLTFTRVYPRAKRQPTVRLRFRDGFKGGRPGANAVDFTGRIGGTRMSTGVWRMTASAYDGTTTVRATIPSKPVFFRIARPGEALPKWK